MGLEQGATVMSVPGMFRFKSGKWFRGRTPDRLFFRVPSTV